MEPTNIWHICGVLFLLQSLILLSQTNYVLCGANSSLSLVTIFYRHGDRSPIGTYPSDPYQEDFWPQGFGQLSKIGIQQEYRLGQYFKQRYIDSGFLNSSYSKYQLYARSTDYERTIMSAQAVLAGMYPPSGEQLWNEGIPWQPVPVHVVPQAYDKLLRGDDCPKLQQLFNETRGSQAAKNIDDQYQAILEVLNREIGVNFTTLSQAHQIMDAFYCEKQHNLTLVPEWATDEMVRTFREHIAPQLSLLAHNDTLKRRLNGGMLIGEVVREMALRVGGLEDETGQRRKVYMFSAHDSTILKVVGALGLYNGKAVGYSTSIMVELHRSTTSPSPAYFVQLWYRNDTTREPYQLQLPGCELNCLYEKFVNITAAVIPVNILYECQLSYHFFGVDVSSLASVIAVSVAVGLGTLLLVLLCLLVVFRKKWRAPQIRKYGRIRMDTVPEEMPMMNNVGDGSDADEI